MEFLRKLYTDALPAKPENQALVRQMLVLEKTDKHTLSGKTGTGEVAGKNALGWFVGHVLNSEKAYTFACNIQGPEANGPKAREIAQKVLKAKGIL